MISKSYICSGLKENKAFINMRIIYSLFLFLNVFSLNAQEIIDTVPGEHGTIVIYSNYTWGYLEDVDFDGVMNPDLHDLVMGDSNLNFIQTWDNDVCYTSNLENNVQKIADTFWICLNDTLNDDFVMPFDGNITSHFGWRRGRNHNGTDIDLNTGDTVRAAWSGKVRYAKYNESGFGNLVIIRHYNGLETFYAHLSKHLVVPNQVVNAGDPIGLGGNTGHSYGSHLHFEVRFYDAPIDPEKVIDFEAKEVKNENLLVHKGLFRGGSYSNYTSSTTTNSAGAVYYRIRSGDTLSAIAARNRTTVSKICQLNGIRPTTVLQIGRNIRIR